LALGAAALGPSAATGQSIDDKREEAREISARLDELTARYERLQDRANTAETELAEVEDQIGQAQARLDDTIEERDERRLQLQAYAVSAFIDGNDGGGAAAAVDTEEEQDVPIRMGYIDTVSGNQQQLIEELNATEDDVAVRVQELEQAQAEAEALVEEIDQATEEAQQAIDEQEQLQSQVDAELEALIEEEREREAAERAAAAAAAQQAEQGGGGGGGPSAGPTPVNLPPPPPASGAAGAVAAARSRIGAPYQWGAAGPNSFDCSGLTMWAWAQAGRSLPHNSGAQYSATRRVSASDLQPGDLVFHGSPIHHVSIYSGGGMVIDAPHSGATVTERSMYAVGTPVGFGRP
jgi:cell wall-associated NlpC family hydrolase